ncbi:unnamed protein product, partial [Gulo gulo]
TSLEHQILLNSSFFQILSFLWLLGLIYPPGILFTFGCSLLNFFTSAFHSPDHLRFTVL